jgi:para-aminobenzoate synthetase component I
MSEIRSAWIMAEVPWPTHLPSTVRNFAGRRELAWLDSVSGQTAGAARFSMVCTDPAAVLQQFDHQPATLSLCGRIVARDSSGWRLWRHASTGLPIMGGVAQQLAPGWVGYVGFEMAQHLERLPQTRPDDLGLPLMRLALFDRAIVLDHDRHLAFALAAPEVRTAVGAEPLDVREMIDRWKAGADCEATAARVESPPEVRFETTRAEHVVAVTRAMDYIAAGDIYQVNLAHRVWLNGLDPLAAYLAIRKSNPAPYAALLRWNEAAIVSASPELFLQLRGESVLTRPIKGTRPRTMRRREDRRNQSELLGSAKEAAELAMIVDLHRNDLGRVCAYGSVRVQAARRLEAHPTVFHTVADVTGRLAPNRSALDLLEACFPAGSISGVPKIRALQIINELERAPRGAYTGAIGVLGLDGQMTFNVAIRTLQVSDQNAVLHVGGGIVADSDPEAEYDETLAKARGILDGLLTPGRNKQRMAVHAPGNGVP